MQAYSNRAICVPVLIILQTSNFRDEWETTDSAYYTDVTFSKPLQHLSFCSRYCKATGCCTACTLSFRSLAISHWLHEDGDCLLPAGLLEQFICSLSSSARNLLLRQLLLLTCCLLRDKRRLFSCSL